MESSKVVMQLVSPYMYMARAAATNNYLNNFFLENCHVTWSPGIDRSSRIVLEGKPIFIRKVGSIFFKRTQ